MYLWSVSTRVALGDKTDRCVVQFVIVHVVRSLIATVECNGSRPPHFVISLPTLVIISFMPPI